MPPLRKIVKSFYGGDYAAHDDPVMSNFAVVYGQSAESADLKVFPVQSVSKTADHYQILDAANWTQSGAGKLVPGQRSPQLVYTLSRDMYQVETWALSIPRALSGHQEDRRMVEMHDRNRVSILMNGFLLSRTQQIADSVMRLGVWAQEWTDGQLNFGASSFTPHSWFRQMRREMVLQSGGTVQGPNTLIIGYDAYNALHDNPKLVGILPSDAPKVVDEALIKRAFDGITRIVVIRAATNEANPTATPDFQFVRPRDAFFCFLPPALGTAPSAVTMFEYEYQGQPSMTIARHVEPLLHQEVFEVQGTWDTRITAPTLGAYIEGAVPAA